MCILEAEVLPLTAFLAGHGSNRGAKQQSLPLAMIVCVALLALLAVVQVAHLHSFDKDSDHCQLCVVLHSAAPAAATAAVVVLAQRRSSAPVFEPHAVIRFWHPQLFTRPPPSDC